MKKNYIKSGVGALFLTLMLTAAPSAWAYDSAIKVGVGSFLLDYKETGQSVRGRTGGLHIGYVGRFNDYLGFEVRFGGAASSSTGTLKIEPSTYLSLLFRPSFPLAEEVEIYGLLGLTSMAVTRTSGATAQQTIARGGSSFGVGADYRITKHMAAGIEWVSYMRNVDYGYDANNSNWSNVPWAKVSFSGATANFKYQF